LRTEEVKRPQPAENEILVKVKASAVNRTDCANLTAKPWIMRLYLGLFKPRKEILGTEFAGIVEELGARVTRFKVGDRVFGFDDSILSSYAEYLVIHQDKGIATMPDELSFIQAAVSIEGAHYAYNFINKVPLNAGDIVLINGASGGIGSATLQLVKYHGAMATAVCDTNSVDMIKSLAADKVIDYQKEDFTSDNIRYEYVFDSVGKSTFFKCKKILKPGGTYMSSELGPNIQNVFLSLITASFGKIPFSQGKKVKFPYPPDILRSILFIKKLIQEGKYKSLIDKTYPIENIQEAFNYVMKGQKRGNVVLIVDPE